MKIVKDCSALHNMSLSVLHYIVGYADFPACVILFLMCAEAPNKASPHRLARTAFVVT